MNAAGYDRAAQDVGNLLLLEHFNVLHNDQQKATLFYVVGLGGTRDPYLMVGLTNMWVNFGRTQAHLPSPQLRGRGEEAPVARLGAQALERVQQLLLVVRADRPDQHPVAASPRDHQRRSGRSMVSSSAVA